MNLDEGEQATAPFILFKCCDMRSMLRVAFFIASAFIAYNLLKQSPHRLMSGETVLRMTGQRTDMNADAPGRQMLEHVLVRRVIADGHQKRAARSRRMQGGYDEPFVNAELSYFHHLVSPQNLNRLIAEKIAQVQSQFPFLKIRKAGFTLTVMPAE